MRKPTWTIWGKKACHGLLFLTIASTLSKVHTAVLRAKMAVSTMRAHTQSVWPRYLVPSENRRGKSTSWSKALNSCGFCMEMMDPHAETAHIAMASAIVRYTDEKKRQRPVMDYLSHPMIFSASFLLRSAHAFSEGAATTAAFFVSLPGSAMRPQVP